jgi:hypothetical protein
VTTHFPTHHPKITLGHLEWLLNNNPTRFKQMASQLEVHLADKLAGVEVEVEVGKPSLPDCIRYFEGPEAKDPPPYESAMNRQQLLESVEDFLSQPAAFPDQAAYNDFKDGRRGLVGRCLAVHGSLVVHLSSGPALSRAILLQADGRILQSFLTDGKDIDDFMKKLPFTHERILIHDRLYIKVASEAQTWEQAKEFIHPFECIGNLFWYLLRDKAILFSKTQQIDLGQWPSLPYPRLKDLEKAEYWVRVRAIRDSLAKEVDPTLIDIFIPMSKHIRGLQDNSLICQCSTIYSNFVESRGEIFDFVCALVLLERALSGTDSISHVRRYIRSCAELSTDILLVLATMPMAFVNKNAADQWLGSVVGKTPQDLVLEAPTVVDDEAIGLFQSPSKAKEPKNVHSRVMAWRRMFRWNQTDDKEPRSYWKANPTDHQELTRLVCKAGSKAFTAHRSIMMATKEIKAIELALDRLPFTTLASVDSVVQLHAQNKQHVVMEKCFE